MRGRRNTEEDFWARVDQSGDCWNWTGRTDKDGYGAFWWEGRNHRAHRWIMGSPDAVVRHSCDNERCVRPSHLIVGTQQENVHDELRAGTHSLLRYSDEVMDAIRADYIPGIFGARRLAAKYGVSVSHVSEIVRGRTRTTRRR